ncbi:MAG TPA: transporter [Campylobacterales bacterium]|nr:transporter [Campylobacterales bacterium]
MNQIHAKVAEIQRLNNLTIVSFDFEGQPMQMMALEISEKLEIGTDVILGMKATNIILSKEYEGIISVSNQLNCIVEKVGNGELLTSVTLRIGKNLIESIITRKSSSNMNLQEGDKVKALINESELSILEIRS